MICTFCGEEMIKGRIEPRTLMDNYILKKLNYDSVVFLPEGEEKKIAPKNTVQLKIAPQEADYCPKCGKATVICENIGDDFWQ